MAGFAVLLAGVIGMLTALWYILFPSKERKCVNKIPGLPTIPILGNALELERGAYGKFLPCASVTRKMLHVLKRSL